MSSRVWQSCIIDATIDRVWAVIRPLDLVYLPTVSTVELDAKDREDTVGTERTIYYNVNNKERTVQRIRLLELSDSRHEISWEIVSSTPPIDFLSANYTIRLRRVTESSKTFLEMTSDFSRDASPNVIEDARYKQKDHFKYIAIEAAKKYTFRSTGENIISGRDLKGKVALITGANSGIGLETARCLAKAGCEVIGTTREQKRGEEAFKTITDTIPGAKVEMMELHLTSFSSIRDFAAAFIKKHKKINYLILNAGVMMIKDRQVTKEGIEEQFGVNHVGHFLLTKLLLDTVKSSAPGRVVVLSSLANFRSGIIFDDVNSEKKYDKMVAYGQSKTANALFALHLNKLLKKENVKVEAFSVHPGSIATDLGRHLSEDDKKFLLQNHYRWKSLQQGAATTLVAALDESLEGKGGAYLSDCNPSKPAPWASSEQDAEKLWKLTEDLIVEKSKQIKK